MMEKLNKFLEFCKMLLEYRYGTGFSAYSIRYIANKLGYKCNEVKSDNVITMNFNQSITLISTDFGRIKIEVKDWQSFDATFIPSEFNYSGKYDCFKFSFSFEDEES